MNIKMSSIKTTDFNTIYKLEIKNHSDTFVYKSLPDAVAQIYNYLINQRGTAFSDIKIMCYYADILASVLDVSYDKEFGLILRSNISYIRLASIYPHLITLDTLLKRTIESNSSFAYNTIENCSTPISIYARSSASNRPPTPDFTLDGSGTNNKLFSNRPPSPDWYIDGKEEPMKIINDFLKNTNSAKTPLPKPQRHISLLNKAKLALEAKQKEQLKEKPVIAKKESRGFDEEFEEKKENERNQRIESNRQNEKFRIFESDKKAYVRIKEDITKGIIKKEEINPFFDIKYRIFQILESREAINFNSNDKIVDEYNIFSALHQACCEDNECAKQPEPVNKVYIPHNYQYLTNVQKDEYAKKYKMTRKEFEDKYVTGMMDDDIIENHINKNTAVNPIPKPPVTTESSNDEDSSDESDTSDNTEDKPKKMPIDPKFLELTKTFKM
jgi:hypothetical protein